MQTPPSRALVRMYTPDGTKKYHEFFKSDKTYHCFLTKEEAIAWKLVELNNLEQVVEDHLEMLKVKTKKKLSALKKKIKFDEYLKKYPDQVLKVV
jgi:uncharacterized protein (DUF885 family)